MCYIYCVILCYNRGKGTQRSEFKFSTRLFANTLTKAQHSTISFQLRVYIRAE